MDHETDTTGRNLRLVEASPLRKTGSQSAALDTRPIADTPENRQQFAASIAPCLTLTAPAGMDQADRKNWYAAAWRAVSHLPADLIRRGAEEASRTADHPSKIVPAIIAYAEPKLRDRRRLQQFAPRTDAPALVAPGKSQVTAFEASEILKQYGLRSKVDAAEDRSTPTELKGGSGNPGRVPTREDYIRMGVGPAVLDRQDDAA